MTNAERARTKRERQLEEQICYLEAELFDIAWYFARRWEVPPALVERTAMRATNKHLFRAIEKAERVAAQAWAKSAKKT
jgi:hypothetical protein